MRAPGEHDGGRLEDSRAGRGESLRSVAEEGAQRYSVKRPRRRGGDVLQIAVCVEPHERERVPGMSGSRVLDARQVRAAVSADRHDRLRDHLDLRGGQLADRGERRVPLHPGPERLVGRRRNGHDMGPRDREVAEDGFRAVDQAHGPRRTGTLPLRDDQE
ncbi:hypothetical protein O159_20710 [Leifsonia xyli subsp. cynodontis DSM 46306]|uniref:Uncharacterized protein n=1 Tax=Leifsonia xyli subsp. cynodontis DSM 46306 TaxID=1389489 RepID=U3P963_LEIXC|nr:hypothetical protein O159_20710 [Leifsonia xyli subsp. cynodontis DSM 46306]